MITTYHLFLESLTRDEDVVKIATDYFKQKLGIKSPVDVRYQNNAFRSDMGQQLGGATKTKSGEYVIFIPNSTLNRMLIVLAHELVHISQFESGRLHFHGNGKYSFDDVIYDYKNYLDEYDDLPFEEEAFTQERVLAQQFAKDNPQYFR